jgi:hypothetical protein
VLVKGLMGSAVYYEGSGWAGELDSLKVLQGYRMNVQSSANLFFDPAAAEKKSLGERVYKRAELLESHGIHPEEYEYSATLIACVTGTEGESFASAGDLLLAFHGNEPRGVSQAEYIPALDMHVFVLTYFSNIDGQEIRFEFLRAETQTEYPAGLVLPFITDNISGEAYHPVRIELSPVDIEPITGSPDELSVYPNPASGLLNVSSGGDLIMLRLYSATGELVFQQEPEQSTVQIPLEHLAEGIYTLEAVTVNRVLIRKIVKTAR